MDFEDAMDVLDEEAMKHGHSFHHTPHHLTGVMPTGSFPLDPSHLPSEGDVNLDPPSRGL